MAAARSWEAGPRRRPAPPRRRARGGRRAGGWSATAPVAVWTNQRVDRPRRRRTPSTPPRQANESRCCAHGTFISPRRRRSNPLTAARARGGPAAPHEVVGPHDVVCATGRSSGPSLQPAEHRLEVGAGGGFSIAQGRAGREHQEPWLCTRAPSRQTALGGRRWRAGRRRSRRAMKGSQHRAVSPSPQRSTAPDDVAHRVPRRVASSRRSLPTGPDDHAVVVASSAMRSTPPPSRARARHSENVPKYTFASRPSRRGRPRTPHRSRFGVSSSEP